MDIRGQGRRVAFRIPHVWDFSEDAISVENNWLDGGAMAAQPAAA